MNRPVVLLVDDDALVLSLISGVLASTNLDPNIFTATNAVEALEICRSAALDCVLLDFDLADMNGLMLAQKIRQVHRHLPIIMCTGVGSEQLAIEAMRGGINDYIPKAQMSSNALERAIGNAIALSRRERTIEEQRLDLESFAVALAHDFKQPIRQIITYSNMIVENVNPGELTKMRRYLSKAARRLDALVQATSDYALLRKPPTLTNVALHKVVLETIQLLDPFIKECNAEVHCTGQGFCRGNYILLLQVMQNLIVNGLKYNRNIRPIVEIFIEQRDNAVFVRVSDNGIGIETEYLNQIFEPFTRLHTREDFEGTGLGLTLVRKAVTAQGGTIRCESHIGSGSTFHLELIAKSDLPLAA